MVLGVLAVSAGYLLPKTMRGDTQGSPDRKLRELRRLNPGAAVCVNPPLNTTGAELEVENAGEELARGLRSGGFASGMLGTLPSCDAVVFTEITQHSRNAVELDFRILLSDEQIPRLCSSARGKSRKGEPWRDAVRRAFADEAGQILKAQQNGMSIYPGALE
jgi:hypothetical protein